MWDILRHEVKMKNLKKKKLVAIKMYFEDETIPKRIEKLAKNMGLSVSSASGMIIRYGLPEMEKAVKKITVEDEKK